MLIGGLQKFSLLDYPGSLSAIIFTQGCNFRCHFCYNPMLVWPVRDGKLKYETPEGGKITDHPHIQEDDLLFFLRERKGKLDAVVITGGEPTLHRDLPDFMRKVKKEGFLVKLDTNGTDPDMLKGLIEKKLVDYLAMDIKSSLENYAKTVNVEVDLAKIKKSIKIIRESGLPHEFRTTVVPGLVSKEDIENIGKMIKGAKAWYLQQFKKDMPLVDIEYGKVKPYSKKELREMKELGRKYVEVCEIR
jgi:pyruvate formate lyase activating enzyme